METEVDTPSVAPDELPEGIGGVVVVSTVLFKQMVEAQGGKVVDWGPATIIGNFGNPRTRVYTPVVER